MLWQVFREKNRFLFSVPIFRLHPASRCDLIKTLDRDGQAGV